MASAAGAVAEKLLRVRHQQAWPRNLYCYDNDEVRRSTGRKIILELPAGRLVIAAEYKAVEDGPLDLNDLQFDAVADAVTEKLPAMVVQFTHPQLYPPQPWAFRLWPINEIANALVKGMGPIELTEQRYIQLLYVLQRGPISAGAEMTRDEGVVFHHWSELSHLDDDWPPSEIWPEVAQARTPRSNRLLSAKNIYVAQRFLAQRARPGPTRLATVKPLIPKRPALGALRQKRNVQPIQPVPEPPRPAPVQIIWNHEDADRYERRCWFLDRFYEAMWAMEPPSEDNRDMWRAWQADGSRRWHRRAAW